MLQIVDKLLGFDSSGNISIFVNLTVDSLTIAYQHSRGTLRANTDAVQE